MNWLAPGETDSLVPPPIELYARIVDHLASLGFEAGPEPANGDEKPDGSVTSRDDPPDPVIAAAQASDDCCSPASCSRSVDRLN